MICIGRMTGYDSVTYCIIKIQYFCSSREDVQWKKMQILKAHKMSKRQIGTVITDFFETDLYLFQSEESFSTIFLFFFGFFSCQVGCKRKSEVI